MVMVKHTIVIFLAREDFLMRAVTSNSLNIFS